VPGPSRPQAQVGVAAISAMVLPPWSMRYAHVAEDVPGEAFLVVADDEAVGLPALVAAVGVDDAGSAHAVALATNALILHARGAAVIGIVLDAEVGAVGHAGGGAGRAWLMVGGTADGEGGCGASGGRVCYVGG